MKASIVSCSFIACLLFMFCSKEQNIEKETADLSNSSETKAFVEKEDVSFFISQKLAEFFVAQTDKEFDKYTVEPVLFNGDTVMYVFNSERGWKIVSSDMRTAPIIAEGGSGRFSIKDKESDISKEWVDDISYHLSSLRDNGETFGNKDVISRWKSYNSIVNGNWKSRMSLPSMLATKADESNTSTDFHWIKVLLSTSVSQTTVESIPHLLKTKWGQDYPWNEKTPYLYNSYGQLQHTKTGCVAVAVSQVKYYFNQTFGEPTGLYETVSVLPNGTGTYTDISLDDYVQNSLRWSSMPLTILSPGNSSYVADLMATEGKILEMWYGLSESLAYASEIVFQNCGLQTTQSSYDFSIILQNLREGKPVIITVPHHCWVIDGYLNYIEDCEDVYGYYYVEDPSSLNGTYNGGNIEGIYSDEEMESMYPGYVNGSQKSETASLDYKFILMNWGEDGMSDDYHYSIYDTSIWRFYYTDTEYSSFYQPKIIYHDISIL